MPFILDYPMPQVVVVGQMARVFTRDDMINVHDKLKTYILTKTSSTSSDPNANKNNCITEFAINGMTLKLKLKTSTLSVGKGPPFESVLSFDSNIKEFIMFPRLDGENAFGKSYPIPLFIKSYDGGYYIIPGLLDNDTKQDEYSRLKSIIDVMAVELPWIINVFTSINTWTHSMRVHFTGYNTGTNRSYYKADVESSQISGYTMFAGHTKLTFRARDDVNKIEIIFNTVIGNAPKTVLLSEIQRTVTAFMNLPPLSVPLATCYRELEQRIDKLLIRML
jgi:hypothetical protein